MFQLADAAHDTAHCHSRAVIALLFNALGLCSTRVTGLVLVYFITTLPYAVWMSKSFIDEVPYVKWSRLLRS